MQAIHTNFIIVPHINFNCNHDNKILKYFLFKLNWQDYYFFDLAAITDILCWKSIFACCVEIIIIKFKFGSNITTTEILVNKMYAKEANRLLDYKTSGIKLVQM